MNKYSIQLSIEAKNDLKRIISYIKNELREPVIAKKYANLIKQEIKILEYMPQKFSVIDSEVLKDNNFRKIVIKNYIVFYRVNEESRIVNIERILYGKTDWQSIL